MKTTISHALLVVATTAIFASCNTGGQQQGYGDAAPQETDFIGLNTGTSSVKSSYPGTIEGSDNVDIKAQVTGYLETIYVKEGDYVQKGQSLFKIKSEVFNEQVNNSNAALKAAIAAQTTAKLEVDKIKPLVEGKVVSEIQLKTAQANYESASAQVAQAKAALGSSQINAGFALIKAPVSGYIGRIPKRIGNLVAPGDETPLTTLSEINTVNVYFSMSEADFIAYKKRSRTDQENASTAELIMADGSAYEHKGKLETASGNIDRATGSMTMKVIFPNPDKLLRAGGAGRIVLQQNMADVLSLPMSSVRDIQDKFFVFKLGDSNKVTMTPIEIAASTGNFYVIKSGLKSGDKIAVNRIDALNEGVQVKPKMIAIDSLSK